MSNAVVRSIQIGRPREYEWTGQADGLASKWTTAFFKSPVAGPVHLRRSGIEGDAVADTRFHGGLDKAVLAYAGVRYEDWRREWESDALPGGGFGENLTIDGFDESNVCIGDRWRIGEVVLEVSQPRQPCWKLGRRWNSSELPKRVIATGRTGWYLRVTAEGQLVAGQQLDLESRPAPTWTVARANTVMYARSVDPVDLLELAELPTLSLAWREPLLERAMRIRSS